MKKLLIMLTCLLTLNLVSAQATVKVEKTKNGYEMKAYEKGKLVSSLSVYEKNGKDEKATKLVVNSPDIKSMKVSYLDEEGGLIEVEEIDGNTIWVWLGICIHGGGNYSSGSGWDISIEWDCLRVYPDLASINVSF